MNAAILLAELRRRGITAQVTPDGRLRLTGPSEDALSPELRQKVAAQRADLLALLRTRAEGQGETARTQPDESDGTIPAWLGWVAAVVGAILLVGSYLAARAPAPTVRQPTAPPPPPAFPLGGPYDSWEQWRL
jgi:hypothetical protein